MFPEIDASHMSSLLRRGLSTLKSIGGGSIMSKKAFYCMQRFVDFLATTGKSTPMGDSLNAKDMRRRADTFS